MDTEPKTSGLSESEMLDLVARSAVALYEELLVIPLSQGSSQYLWAARATGDALQKDVRALLEKHHQLTTTALQKTSGIQNEEGPVSDSTGFC